VYCDKVQFICYFLTIEEPRRAGGQVHCLHYLAISGYLFPSLSIRLSLLL
jgi:hypothetical protein